MEAADKDKPLPEISPSKDDSKTDNHDDDKITSKDSHPEKPDDPTNQDSSKKHEETQAPSPHKPPSDNEQPKAEADDDLKIKDPIEKTDDENPNPEAKEEKEEGKEGKEEESSPPPPPLDPKKLFEEIDEYIITLSESSKDNKETEPTPPPDVPHAVHQFATLVEARVRDYDSVESPVRWARLTEEDSSSFLEVVNRLSSLSNALSLFLHEKKYADALNHAGDILERVMSYVEEEFKLLLQNYDFNHHNEAKPKQPPSLPVEEVEPEQDSGVVPDSNLDPIEEKENTFFPGYPEETLSHLIQLSEAMIGGGHEAECRQAYLVARRNALEDGLHKLGMEKYSIDEVQKMQWEMLEREIATWISTLKHCSVVHFPSEKNISSTIFSRHPLLSEALFCALSQSIINQLLNFAGAVALTKRATEKLFKFLDMYEALRDTLPAVESLFPEESADEIRTEGSVIRNRLGEASISIFIELEGSIKSDSGKTPVPGGAVHPLTRYTMNYLKYACEYRETLEQVFREHQKIERADSSNFSYDPSQASQTQASNEASERSPFQNQMAKVMELLDGNLESKSRLYKDHALGSIFMMNNGRYILQKVRGSVEINGVLGDTWCRRRSSDLRQYHKVYQRETWGRLLGWLHPDGLTSNGKVAKPVLKERFKSFNAMFDEIQRAQGGWVVSDEQLRSELRVSISNMVVPAYRSFLGRYSQVFTAGRQTEKYVKYQAEDIENIVDELFNGNAAPVGKRKT
ncbi:exocyst subunit exo70 family protein C2 [Striga hermonthica]|uniref:Exocyst subunit Exo70 family protein n=1 Tax=Striga hermonthica TaxID=68872 RepID=A0A9N7NN87_STRHE|nr:exocyst subunit exo70 family protein C2 [Striga hermonthica]